MKARTHRPVLMAVLVAIGTATAGTLWFPAGVAKAYPVQHAINVLAAVFLGPMDAMAVAFIIALLRNLLGLGTLMAFPGGMVGALLAGLAYRWSNGKVSAGLVGEVFGTGVLERSSPYPSSAKSWVKKLPFSSSSRPLPSVLQPELS
jgi:energy coupling factor transporter S component ThiW